MTSDPCVDATFRSFSYSSFQAMEKELSPIIRTGLYLFTSPTMLLPSLFLSLLRLRKRDVSPTCHTSADGDGAQMDHCRMALNYVTHTDPAYLPLSPDGKDLFFSHGKSDPACHPPYLPTKATETLLEYRHVLHSGSKPSHCCSKQQLCIGGHPCRDFQDHQRMPCSQSEC